MYSLGERLHYIILSPVTYRKCVEVCNNTLVFQWTVWVKDFFKMTFLLSDRFKLIITHVVYIRPIVVDVHSKSDRQ